MFKIRILIIIITITYSIKFSSANDKNSEIFSNFLNFENIKINLFTIDRTTVLDNKDSTRSDEDCLAELNKIGNGVKKLELWAIKRKIFLSKRVSFR